MLNKIKIFYQKYIKEQYDKYLIKKNNKKLQYEFLPSALEIVESPPCPYGAGIINTIFLILFVFIIFSSIAKVDEVAIARGKIIPNGKQKVIQTIQEGIITGIYVEEGQKVKKGQLLIELDSSIKKADKDIIQTNLEIAEIEKTLLEKYLDNEDMDTIKSYIQNTSISQEIKNSLIDFAQSRKDNYEIKKQTLSISDMQAQQEMIMAQTQLDKLEKMLLISKEKEEYLRQMKENIGVEAATVEKIEENIDILKQQEQKYKELSDIGAIAKQEWINKNNELKLMEKEYETQKAKSENEKNNENLRWKNSKDELEMIKKDIELQKIKVEQAESKIKETKAKIENIDIENSQETLNLILEKQKQIETQKVALEKMEKSIQYQSLTSPVNGIVQGISLNTIGGVVTPAQSIMSIVPENTPLIVEAMLTNKDIGFVTEGQKASIKIDTFSFQKYGLLEGTVIYVSPDAFEDEKHGSVYKIKVELKKDSLQVEGKELKISPGMSVSVEIKTGQRRIIEFFLEPLVKYVSESLTLR